MITQTAEFLADKKDLIQTIELLSAREVLRVKGYIERIREDEILREAKEEERIYQSMTLDEIKAEIASLEAKYGTTPNTETIAAMQEVAAGLGEPTTLEEIKAECDALLN
jgi:hypothetical protein